MAVIPSPNPAKPLAQAKTPKSSHQHASGTRRQQEDSVPYVHQGLTVSVNPSKGRQVTSTAFLKDGEVLMVDAPYALVPAMIVDRPPFHLCSRHDCNRRIPAGAKKSVCLRGCAAEVVWCNDECRGRDSRRHSMECSWLEQLSPEIRATYGDSDFGLLWLIARILIVRHLNATLPKTNGSIHHGDGVSPAHFGKRGWDAVWNLEGHIDAFPAEKVERWGQFAEMYLVKEALLEVTASAEEVVDLICKVETNSFGLYPGVTGEYPVISFVSRGDYYGGGIYPIAAMFNHSCCPNVIHKLDAFGRRIFEASRDIKPGEECCISYFDLVEFTETKVRQDEIFRSWNFVCGCQRCADKGDFELPQYLKDMDFD